MRYVIYGMLCFAILLHFLQMMLIIDTRVSHQERLEQATGRMVMTCLRHVQEKKIVTKEQVEKEFIEGMRELAIENSDLMINFIENDPEKGILSVCVEESYVYPNGQHKSVQVSRTGIIEDIVKKMP